MKYFTGLTWIAVYPSLRESQTEPWHCMGQEPGPVTSPIGHDGNLFQVVKTLQGHPGKHSEYSKINLIRPSPSSIGLVWMGGTINNKIRITQYLQIKAKFRPECIHVHYNGNRWGGKSVPLYLIHQSHRPTNYIPPHPTPSTEAKTNCNGCN